MSIPNIYLVLSDGDGCLAIDGSLDLFNKLVNSLGKSKVTPESFSQKYVLSSRSLQPVIDNHLKQNETVEENES